MYIDSQLLVEPGVTVRTNGVISENVIDLAATGGNYDAPGFFIMQVTQAFNNLTTLEIDLITDDIAALTSAPIQLGSFGVIPLASLTLGANFVLPIPDAAVFKRFHGLKYTVVGTAPTTGLVVCKVVPDYRMNAMIGSTAIKMFSK